MSLWTTLRDSVEDKAKDAWDAIIAFLTPVEQAVLAFAKNGLEALETELGQDGIAAVQAAVAAAEQTGLSGPEKFDQAKKALENTLKASIPTLKDSVINLAIELAVQGLKALIPAAA